MISYIRLAQTRHQKFKILSFYNNNLIKRKLVKKSFNREDNQH